MANRAVPLTRIEELLDDTFAIKSFGVDPAFSRFIPMVYDPIEVDWRRIFELEFTERFNGTMIRGARDVFENVVHCVSARFRARMDP